MTNRELLREAARSAAPEASAMLSAVKVQASTAPVRRVALGRGMAGWVCAACLFAFILFGYFGNDITSLPEAGMPTAPAAGAEIPQLVPDGADGALPKCSGTEEIYRFMGQPQNSAYVPEEASAPKPAWDGWVHTSPAPGAPVAEENSGGKTGGGWYTFAPASPNNKPGKPSDPDNPDTGGGGEEITASYPFAEFTQNTRYAPFLPPSPPQGFAPLPFVHLFNDSYAEVCYENVRGTRLTITLLGLTAPTVHPRGGPGFYRIMEKSEITPELLHRINSSAETTPEETEFLFLELDIKGIQNIIFACGDMTYEEAARALQSLPVFG